MIKLIVSDLDGTLVCNHRVSDVNRTTIHKLQQDGYLFTVATGRHIDSARRITDSLDLSIPFICNNGAQIYDPITKSVLHEVLLEEQDVNETIQFCERHGIVYLLNTRDDILCTIEGHQLLLEHVGEVPVKEVSKETLRASISEGIIKVLAITFDNHLWDELSAMTSRLDRVLSVASQQGFLNIGHRDATKGKAMLQLANRLHISKEQILSLGDQQNDMSLVIEAGIGVAMGDGITQLKHVADHVADAACNDGFAQAIAHFIYDERTSFQE